MAVTSIKTNNMSSVHLQNQLTRSLERILEDAHLSGELKLSGRKLKDFPKAAGKFNLSDTVIADLSRNRFCELPEDVTSFPFLEKLFVYHNALRIIPETIRGLHSLTYLDLRSNQLSSLPKDICFLPLQVLLVSNNRLVSLPEELGRMEKLTELDASCNQITHLPTRISDLKNLRSLSLRSNQLVYLPREITCLQLIFLNISCNRIATLPIELRLMTSLVDLELENNPLTSPPASLCVRGLVHVFKFLETIATKDEKSRLTDGNTTLRRTVHSKAANNVIDNQRIKRSHIDSGYSTSDGTDKRWSQEMHPTIIDNSAKWSPTPIHVRTDIINHNLVSGTSTPSTLSPSNSGIAHHENKLLDEELKQSNNSLDKQMSSNNSSDVSPENENSPDNFKYEDRKAFSNVQTYREYKEALRQQRNQDSNSVYRIKDQITPPENGQSSFDSLSYKSQTSTPSPSTQSSSQSSPHHNTNKTITSHLNGHNSIDITDNFASSELSNKSPGLSPKNTLSFEEPGNVRRPIQKVVPSRNVISTYQPVSPNATENGNHSSIDDKSLNLKVRDYNSYVKPKSPTKSTSALGHNTIPGAIVKSSLASNGHSKAVSKSAAKQNRSVSWNREIPADKLSFTMRREFDKQKEETELIHQLRRIIESRLKMTLPDDIAPALTDGVVLCHLANHVRPRSVASIHVPSPAVPKLTMARCRRNVDNFLEACRKIGIDDELICSCADVVPQDETTSDEPPNPSAMFRTLAALLIHPHQESSATNTKTAQDASYDNYFKTKGIHFSKSLPLNQYENKKNTQSLDEEEQHNYNENEYDVYEEEIYIDFAEESLINNNNMIENSKANQRKAPTSLDLFSNRKPKLSSVKRNFYLGNQLSNNKYDNFQLNGIIEECEYDSDIGKFNCKNDVDNWSDASSASSDPMATQNDLNTPTNHKVDLIENNEDFNIYSVSNDYNKIVEKQSIFFQNNSPAEKIVNSVIIATNDISDENNRKMSTILCLGTFLLSIILLIIFPLPN